MARQRRGGGFRPPELRGTLGTLLRTAAAQVGPLKDAMAGALERTAREGRARFDDVRTSRRRTDALAELGEIVLDLIRRGEIDVAEIPEAQDIVAHLDELDAGHPPEDDESFAAPPVRNRFDSRRRDEDDGTVSSGAAASTRSRAWPSSGPVRASSGLAARPASRPAPRVWRPPVDDNHTGVPDDQEPPPSGPVGRPKAVWERPVPRPKDPQRKGGISFEDDDEDLSEYMHPDDVPAKKADDE